MGLAPQRWPAACFRLLPLRPRMSSNPSPILQRLDALADRADDADAQAVWPSASWDLLREFGVLGWSIPGEFGGQDLPPTDLLSGYERIAGACLTTAFILSQREAAVRRLLEHGRPDLKRRLLPDLAAGRTFASVGLS